VVDKRFASYIILNENSIRLFMTVLSSVLSMPELPVALPMLNSLAGYTHSDIGRTLCERFMSHQLVE
jgi:hypothetical protein